MNDDEKEIEALKKKHGLDKTVAEALGRREAEVENSLDVHLREILIKLKHKLKPPNP
jgi:hypothetical protein